ncbi:ASCH domain-containing protein [Sphingobacterium sp. InxBP1]|uniref:ASCH domain-containing protein n=1 Tax=Sphingobacterium sp. InxBP1 TaxID=2870328 RepID=UPI00224420DA|nr:ASCH domain-containing protein [Sphingobacterium sp. InxBP1]MCW8309666.1 ASCH domain-containing protein [Sphingobacterium sp. InxBP1]
MKALSIKQPWASLVCTPRLDNPLLGIKDIENRTWATKYRGTIYIHASGKSAGELNKLLTEDQYESLPSIAFLSENYPKSAIIGTVDIVDCVINHSSIWAEKTNEFLVDIGDEKPIYNWVLANPVLFDEPILNVKGKLSLWEFYGKEINS